MHSLRSRYILVIVAPIALLGVLIGISRPKTMEAVSAHSVDEGYQVYLPGVFYKFKQNEIVLADFDGPVNLLNCNSANSSINYQPGYLGKGIFVDNNPGVETIVTCPLENSSTLYGISFWMNSDPDTRLSIQLGNDMSAGKTLLVTNPYIVEDTWTYYSVLFPKTPLTVTEITLHIDTYWRNKDDSSTVGIDEIWGNVTPVSIDLRNVSTKNISNSINDMQSIIGIDYNQRTGPDQSGLSIANEIPPQYVRTDILRWHANVFNNNRYDFSKSDPLINLHTSYGFTTLLNIHGGNDKFTGAWNNPPITPQELAAWGDYNEAVAKKYKGKGIVYEIWPEPSMAIWSYRPLTAQEWANILNVAASRIKLQDPSATVISGGVLGFDIKFIQDAAYFSGFDHIDGFATHYRDYRTSSNTSQMLRDLFVRLNLPPMSLWDTENGWSDPEGKKVAYIFLSCLASGYEGCVYWPFQDYSDDPGGTGWSNGLIDVNYQKRAYFDALDTLANVVDGKNVVGILDLPTNVFGILLNDATANTYLLWTVDNESRDVIFSNSCVIVNQLGNAIPTKTENGNLAFEFNAGNSPAYITCSK